MKAKLWLLLFPFGDLKSSQNWTGIIDYLHPEWLNITLMRIGSDTGHVTGSQRKHVETKWKAYFLK